MRKGQVTRQAAGVEARGGYPTIGLLCREISSEYGMAIWNGVSSAAQKRGANLICVLGGSLGLASHSEDGMANQLYDLLDADTFDGLVMWGAALGHFGGPQTVRELCARCHPLPVVNIGLELAGIPNVLADNYQGARDVVAHLIEAHGYRRIAYLSGSEANWEARERYRGYTGALAEHGLPFDPALVVHSSDLDELGRRRAAEKRFAMRFLMDERGLRPQVDFEAVMAYDDDMGLHAMNTLQARGVQVPGEVAVASFDDVEGAWCVTPPLTTARQPLHELGRQAAEMLLDWIAGGTPPASKILPMQVVARQSCGCASKTVTEAAVEVAARAAEGVSLDTALSGQREAILAEVSQAAGPALSDADPAWAERLLTGFIHGVESASPGAFLETLENTLNRVALMEGDLQTWPEALATLRRDMLPYLRGDTLLRAERLWLQAGMLVSEVARRVQARRTLLKAQWTQTLFEIGRSLITTFEVQALMNRLVEGLPRLGIPGCYLAVYEDPQAPTRWSRLLLAYDEGGPVNLADGGRRFSSRRWVSEKVLPLGRAGQAGRPRSYVAEPLYFREHQIGFALVEVGPREGMVYELLRGEVSSALYGAQLVQQLAHRAVQLQTAAEVSQTASSLLNPDALIRQVVALVRERFELGYVGLFLVDRSGDWTGEPGRWVVLRAGTGNAGRELLAGGYKLEIGDSSIIGWCVAHKQSRVAQDDVGVEANTPLLSGTRSELGLPLVSRGEVIGALSIQSSRPAAFGEQDIAAFQTMADQLANAICNADLYEQAQKAQETAEAANRAKSTFLANMSHELRTPLNGILGYAQILKQRQPNPDFTRGLTIIQQSGEHLLTLINDILDLAKVEAGKVELHPVSLHLPGFLEGLAAIVRARAEAKSLAFSLEKPNLLPARVLADETRLRQVLLNLLGNAVKFTDAGHVTLRVTGSQQAVDSRQEELSSAPRLPSTVYQLRFEVEDTGPGIPADQVKRIFQPFEQVGETGKRAEGTGLGLAISRQLAQLMGGDIQVESPPTGGKRETRGGPGSVFWFEVALPLEEGLETPPEPPPARVITGYTGLRRAVLVVDDIASNRAVILDLLGPLGFEVIEAEDGQQGLELARQRRPDLILMDRRMPVLSGLEAVRQIRQTPELRETPIIAISASVSVEEQAQSRAVGYDDFLPKPIHWPDLAAMLAKHLRLEWQYEEKGEGREARMKDESSLHPFEVPPPAELAIFYDLARRGSMRAIREQASRLEQTDERFKAFARHVYHLAERFEEEAILALLERYRPGDG